MRSSEPLPHARGEHRAGQMMIDVMQQIRVTAHAHAKLWVGAGKRPLDDLGDSKWIDTCLDPAVEEAADALTTFRVGARADSF